MYKISIILPVYNVKEYLEDCFQSLLKQTIGFNNLEIIFVDDCSTDNSFEIIKKFALKYENVKVYQTEKNSGGCGQPRNIGMKYVTAPYIMFLDPDDTYYENACEILYSKIVHVDGDFVSGNYIEYKNGKSIKHLNFKKLLNLSNDYLEIDKIEECPDLLLFPPIVWVKIYKKSFLIKNNLEFLNYTVAEDLYFVNQCLLKANKIVYVDVPIVKYMIRESEEKSKSLTASRNAKNLLGYAHVYNKAYSDLLEYNPEFAWMITKHLFFCTQYLVLSNTTAKAKMDFFYNTALLYEEFEKIYLKKEKYYNEFKSIYGENYLEFKLLFDLICEKRYIHATSVANLMKILLSHNEEFDLTMFNKNIIILYDENIFCDNNINIFKVNLKLLLDNKFNIYLINCINDSSSINNNIKHKNELLQKNISVNKNIKIINLNGIFSDNLNSMKSKNTYGAFNSIYDKNDLSHFSSEDYINYFISNLFFDLNEEPHIINNSKKYKINNQPYTFLNLMNIDLFKSNLNFNKLKKILINIEINKIKNNLFSSKFNYEKVFSLDSNYNQSTEKTGKITNNKGESILYKQNTSSINNSKLNEKDVQKNYHLNKKYEDMITNLKTSLYYYKLKSNTKKRLFSPFNYLYILFNRNNIIDNIKLYKKLQKSDLFDIGFYLNNNPDISREKWCKFLTPELHYVCHGFYEGRKINETHNTNLTKKELNIICSFNEKL